MARTAMDGATASQQRWAVDGDGRCDGDSTAMESTAMDGDDLTAMDGLMAMDGDVWQWTSPRR